jgi:hypothetical protein
MFIRKRPSSKNRCSYQIVETFRSGAKVRHRTLLNLSNNPTLQQAIEDARCRNAGHRLAQLLEFHRLHPEIR